MSYRPIRKIYLFYNNMQITWIFSQPVFTNEIVKLQNIYVCFTLIVNITYIGYFYW